MAATIKKIQAPNHEAAVFEVSGSPDERIVILEYQTFNLLAVQMRYGKPMGIECKALRTIYFVS